MRSLTSVKPVFFYFFYLCIWQNFKVDTFLKSKRAQSCLLLLYSKCATNKMKFTTDSFTDFVHIVQS